MQRLKTRFPVAIAAELVAYTPEIVDSNDL
jgi:hypothetical protein